MKKVIALIMAAMLLLSMGVSVFAADNFLTSPSQKGAPEIIEYECDCDGRLVIVPYKDRDTMPEGYRAIFEESFASIVNAKSLADLCKALVNIAKQLKIAEQDMIVSDLFYVYMEGCTVHSPVSTFSMRTTTLPEVDHGPIKVTLKPETLDNYVALMSYENGEWSVVEDAKVTPEGHLQFTMYKHGPFAIVVHTSPAQTGDMFTVVGVSVFAIAAACMIVVLVKTKKKV